MANNYMGNMTFGVNFKVDTQALDKLDTRFDQIGRDIDQMLGKANAYKDNGMVKQLTEAKKASEQLYTALSKAYNVKLGQFDLSKVNAELRSVGTNLGTVASSLNSAGQNVNGILNSLMSNRLMIKESNQFLDKMAVTFGNTIRWSITNKIINTITSSIQKAFYFTKDLDRSLNDIRIVTGKSADEMERFAKQATNAAQSLGRTTTDYTKASLLFYQQGLSDQEVAARTQTTLKAANVTGQSTSEVSEQLTAVWNGYKVSAAETELYVDKLAKVAASTASDLEELSTGMSKVASAANMMGVDIDQLNAQLSTVISVTRQAPETIGAAFKTIYSRMSTIKAGGIDEEDGATLTSYTEKMNQFGISVLDSNGKLRDMGSVIEEIGDKWDTFSREAQVGLAQAMGGTRQYSNLTALFENWDKYQEALKTSQNATGTLQKQQDIYMDSVSAHFKQLTAEAEKFYQNILDEDVLKDLYDGLKFVVEEINNMIKAIGGGKNALISLGATFVNVFSNQIGKSLGQFANQRAALRVSQRNVDEKTAMAQFYGDQNRDALTRRQKKYYDSYVNEEEQRKLRADFFNKPLSPEKTNREKLADSNAKGETFISNDVLKESAQTQSRLLEVARYIGKEKYNELTTENEQLTILKAKKENYELINKEVQEFLEKQDDIKTVSELNQRLQESTTEEIEKQIKALEQKKQDLAPQQATASANTQTARGQVASIDAISKMSGKNIDINSLLRADGKFNQNKSVSGLGAGAPNSQLKQMLDYYKALGTKANELKISTVDQENALKEVNNALDNGAIKESRLKAIITTLSPLEEELANKKKEFNKQANESQKEEEKLARVEAEIDSKIKDENENLKERSKLSQFDDIKEQVEGLATGDAQETDRQINIHQGNIDERVKEGQRQKNITTGFQKASGAIRAATAMVGGFNTMMDKSLSKTDRFNGLWEGVTGGIAGAVSAVNPMAGMLISMGANLGKMVLDATGLSEQLSNMFKNKADEMRELREELHNANEELSQATQKINEYNNSNKEFHNTVRSLGEMKDSWDKINAKMQAGISLTNEEEQEYQSMAEQILSLNSGITYTYDEQHKLIINNNEALDDTIKKLEKEKEIQDQITKQKILAEAKDKLGNAQNAKERYEENLKDYENNEEYINNTKEQFNFISELLANKQILNYNGFKDLSESSDKISDTGMTYYNDLIKIFDGTEEGFNKLMESIANDTTKADEVHEKLEKLANNTTEDLNIAGTFDNIVSFGLFDVVGGAIGSDIFDPWEEIQKQDLPSIAQTITGIADDSVLEYDEVTKAYIDAMKQLFGTDFSIKMKSTGSDIVDKIIANQAENTFDNLMLDENTDYEKILDNLLKSSKSYATTLNENADVIEKVSKSIGNINTDKLNMSATDYYNAIEKQIQELQEAGIYDTNVYDTLFGKGNYGKDLRNKMYGIEEETVVTPYGTAYSVQKNEGVAAQYGKRSGENIEEIFEMYSITEAEHIIDFMKEYLDNPSEYADYGKDFVDQFEGYLHEHFNSKIFKDFLEEMNNDLDTLKQSALSGEELDDETFEKLNEQLYKYRNHLQEVSTEREILADKDLYGTQVWYESLQRVEQELQKAQEKILLDERNKLIIDVGADTTIAEDELNDLLDQDYKIVADIEIQHKDSYETAVKEVENLQKALSYVGEEGKVAVDNVLDFLNAFPELNDMITTLNSDGSISLTKEQIELIKQRTQVDINGTIAAREMELQTQLNRVQQEKKRVQEQIKLTEDAIEAHKNETDNKAEFEKAFLQIYTKYNDAQEQITEENNDAISTDSWQTADAVSKYWVNAYNDADTAYAKFVNDVVQGNKVLRGEETDWTHHEMDISSAGVEQYKGEDNKTDSQKLLDDAIERAKGAEDEVEAFYNQVLLNLQKEFESLGMTEEEIENEMLSLHAIGLKNVDDAKNLGKATKETEKQGKDLYDVYHNINKELEFISQKMTILQKKQKLLKDDALLKNLQAQSKEYDNQINALNEKLAIQRGYAQELQTRQTNALGDKGLAAYGVEFDENGYIKNYAEIAKKLQAAQNSDEAVKDYENFINEVKVYEENLKLALDLEGQIYDAIAKRHEAQSQAIQTKVEMILDVSKAEKQYLDFTKKLGSFDVNLIINPDQTTVDAAAAKVRTAFMKASAEALPEQTALMEAGNAAIKKLTKQAKKGSGSGIDWNGQHYNPEDIYQLNQDVEALGNSITENAEQIQQAYQESLDAYSNALKELNDWDKRILAKYDMIHGVYDHAEKLTKLWYGEDSLEARSMLTNLSREKADSTAEQAREANEQVKRNWDEYQRAVATGNEKLAVEAYDVWADSVNNLQKLTEQFAEERKKQLEDEVALASKIVETQIYGGKSREEMMNSWELLNKQAEMYLDTINAQFGVTQLENKYIQAINKTVGNSKAQEKLNKIMSEEMKMLKEKDKLTKYDLERAEAKYDLTLKQIALEEARENKTNLRLRRDSQGNYTYQYTANEDDILKVQNDVDIAQNNLYNMDKKQTESLAQQAFEAESEYAAKLLEIRQKFADDDEARKTAEAELYNAYYGETGILTGILAEWKVANQNISESIDFSLNGKGEGTVLSSFEKLRQNLPEEITKLSPALDPGIQSIINKWTDEDTGVASAYKILEEKTDTFFEDYKADIEKFATDIDQDSTFGAVRTAFDATKVKVDEFKAAAAEATTAIGSLNDASSEFSFNNVINDLTSTSDIFGDGNSDGLIKRINDANTSLLDLANLDSKRENLNTIYEELKKQKKLLEKYKDNFDNAKKAMNSFYKKMIKSATEATTIADGVAESINKIKDKTVTITTIHVDKYTTSGDKGGKSGSGSDTTKVGLPDTTGDGGGSKGGYHYNIYYNGTPLYSSSYANEGQEQLIYLRSKLTKIKDFSEEKLELKTEAKAVAPKDLNIVDYVANEGQSYEAHQYYFQPLSTPPYSYTAKSKKLASILSSLDTGGYTGAWGEQGKLALLHEKELVLNKQDTQKFLDALDIVRQLDVGNLESNMYESFLLAQKKIIGEWSTPENQSATIQNITINADFPDASDRDEIKAAFDSLVNLASQRAYTKRH